jgi:hypothetical protein
MPLNTLISVFGLLLPIDPGEPQGEILHTETLDHFRVDTYANAKALTCKCRRFNQICLHPDDFKKIRPVSGLFACPICLTELKTAKSDSDRIAAWFAQNRHEITQDAHLYLPSTFSRLVDSHDKILMRPRRFVFAKFYGVELSSKDKILTTCGDPECINPYHMMRAKSPAAKVTPEIRLDVLTWTQKNLPNQMIKDLIEIKHNKSLSLRTISTIKNSVLV